MKSVTTPKRIYHINSLPTDDRKLIVDDVIEAFHMRQNEAKLLRFYALNCSNGFAPAKAYITKMTGIDKGNISKTRELLEEDMLIQIGSVSILIDWYYMRLFGSLKGELAADGTPAISKQRRNRHFHRIKFENFCFPAEDKQYKYIRNLAEYPEDTHQHQKAMDIVFGLALSPDQMSKWLSTLTNDEYIQFRSNIRDYRKRFPDTPRLTVKPEELDINNELNEMEVRYTDEDLRQDTLFLMSHLGDIRLKDQYDYSVINRDNELWHQMMYPDEDKELVIEDEYNSKPDWIATYEVPF